MGARSFLVARTTPGILVGSIGQNLAMPIGRGYDESRDLAAMVRMWRECGWIDDSDRQAEGLRLFLSTSHTLVADVRGEAEAAVNRTSGTFRHLDRDLSLAAITGVITSHVGRHQGLATRLLAEQLAVAVAEGAAVSVLGMFEQGFYDRLGFGTGPDEHWHTFDPAMLTVPVPDAVPVRLTPDDHGEVHDLMLRRHRGHGSVLLDPPELLAAELRWHDHLVALGFRDPDDGRLTHFLAGDMADEHGPLDVRWLAYESPRQALELLGLLRSLSDQLRLVELSVEPPEIHLQDVLRTPNRHESYARLLGRRGGLHRSFAEMQVRMLDVRACLEAVATPVPVDFALVLDDPLARVEGAPWAGVGGEYTIRLGKVPTVTDGVEAGLPTLRASVNAFSRLWVGAMSASSLALTDDLDGSDELLAALDRAFRLPVPADTWTF